MATKSPAGHAQRILFFLLTLASVLLLSGMTQSAPAMAQAACTPTGNETLKADSYRHQPGQTVTVTGSGYRPSCTLRVSVLAPDLSAATTVMTTDAAGNLSYSFVLNSLAGRWEVGTFMGEDTDPWTSTPITNGAYIETDMLDYAPGNPVTISGAGWMPGESVTINIDTIESADRGATFTFTPRANLAAEVDSAGSLTNSDFVTVLALDYGRAFRASATGQSSGFSAMALFTDAFTATSRADGNWNADATWSITRSGSITTLTSSPTVTGTGTNFLTELSPGDVITRSGTPEGLVIGTVQSIGSNTSLTLTANAANANAGAAWKARKAPAATDDVVIQGFSTVTVTAPASINSVNMTGPNTNTLTINAGQSLTVAAPVIVTGNGSSTNQITVNGTLSAPSINISGGGNGSSIGRVNVNTGGSVVVSGAITVNANSGPALLDLSSGSGTASAGSLDMTASSNTGGRESHVDIGTGSVTVAGNFTTSACDNVGNGDFHSNCFLTFSAASSILHVGGDLQNDLSVTNFTTGGGSTIDFNGPGASSIPTTPNAFFKFQNLAVNKTGGGTATFAGSTQINGNVTVTTGTLAAGGSATLTFGGSISNAGTIAFDGGAAGCGTTDLLLLRSTAPGTARSWSGAGTFSIADVSVQDQNGPITALSSVLVSNSNWTISSLCTVNYTVTPSSSGNGTIAPSTPQSVASGAQPVFTLTPAAGYHSLSVTGTCGGMLVGDTFTTAAVTADCTVIANFAINTYTLAYTAGANGTISGSSPQTVNDGASGTLVTAVPNAGYHFVSWSDGVLTAARTDSNVHANLNVTASFAIDTYTLTYTAGANGTISGTSPQTVNDGASGTAVTAVADAGYHFVSWSDGVLTAARTDSNVHANVSVTASFAINTYTLTYTAGANGTISGTSPQTVNSGASGTAVTAVPNAGYHFQAWSDGVLTASRTDINVAANINVAARFAIDTYTLTYTAGANGTITGTSPQMVNHGANGNAVTAVADAGYHFVSWSDGVLTAARTDSNVHANLNVTASFAIDTFTLTFTAGANGTITGNSPQTVNDGVSGTLVTAVPNAGYHFVSWSDGVLTAARTDSNVHANVNVTASFAIDTYTLAYAAGANGTITGNSPQTVNDGASGTLVTAVPNTGYHFVSWSDGVLTAARTDSNVHANLNVTASFAIDTYTLAYTVAGTGGTISGTSPQTVNHGASGTVVTAVANAGYVFLSWSDSSTANPRTDTNVTNNIAVTASFTPVLATDTTSPITSDTAATPNPVALGTSSVTLKATVSDVTTGGSNIASAQYSIDGSSTWISMDAAIGEFFNSSPTVNVTASLTGLATTTGVHSVCVRGQDQAGNTAESGTECILVAVYDANAGFVTGGGWINSPAGAMPAKPTATGKANFGFVSKYQNGKTVPTGDTEFNFKAGDFNFKSTSYDWLVISGGKASYQGNGTINGVGDYKFILTVIDGDVGGAKKADTFRLKVYADNQGNGVVYDNNITAASDAQESTTAIGGGSIVIHNK